MLLTGSGPATDATSAASSGLLDVQAGTRDHSMIDRLELPPDLFAQIRWPEYRRVPCANDKAVLLGCRLAFLSASAWATIKPVFFGSVAELNDTILVNVGTGGQVAAYSEKFVSSPNLETRPFPAVICWSRQDYAAAGPTPCSNTFAKCIPTSEAARPSQRLFDTMNRLAAGVAGGRAALETAARARGRTLNCEAH